MRHSLHKTVEQLLELQKIFDDISEVVETESPEREAILAFNNLMEEISNNVEKKLIKRVNRFVKKLVELEKEKDENINNLCRI